MPLPDFRAEVRFEATVSPSEDPLKVAAAIGSVGGFETSAVVTTARKAILSTSEAAVLARVRDKLRDRHVRSAARRQLLLNKKGRSTSMMLNRQAAAAGVLALCGTPEESPLGPVFVTIESDRLDDAIDWLTAYDEG